MDNANDRFNEMDSLFDLAIARKPYLNVTSGYWSPPTDIFETDTSIMISIEIPGMKKENIDVTYDKGYLFVSGERAHICPSRVSRIHRMEINYGRFLRKIKVQKEIDIDKIEAEYRDGILTITIPKRG